MARRSVRSRTHRAAITGHPILRRPVIPIAHNARRSPGASAIWTVTTRTRRPVVPTPSWTTRGRVWASRVLHVNRLSCEYLLIWLLYRGAELQPRLEPLDESLVLARHQ